MSPIEPSDIIFGELSDAERAEAERLMREDPAFRAQVERLRPTAERLAELPAEAWQDLEPPPPPAVADLERPARPPKRRRRFVLRPAVAAGLACVLIAAGVGAGILLGKDDGPSSDGPSYGLEPIAAGESGESGTVSLDDAEREVVIRVKGLPASAPDQFYEAWLLSGTDRVVSLGGFRVDDSGKGELRAQLPDDPRNYRFFDVSVETADGDASHSGRSVLRGQTS